MDFVDDKWLTNTLGSQSSCSLKNKTRCCYNAECEKHGNARSSPWCAWFYWTWALQVHDRPEASQVHWYCLLTQLCLGRSVARNRPEARWMLLAGVYSPRTTGWLHHVLHPLLTLPCRPYFLLHPELPVSPIVHFHWQCVPSSLLHSQILPVSPWTALLALLFYFFPPLLFLSLAITPNLLLQHFQTFPWWSPARLPLPWAALLFLLHDSKHQWLVIRESKLKASLVCYLAFISAFNHSRFVRSVF